jgi:hypothetical protein
MEVLKKKIRFFLKQICLHRDAAPTWLASIGNDGMQVVVEDSDKLVSVEEPSFFDEAAGLL